MMRLGALIFFGLSACASRDPLTETETETQPEERVVIGTPGGDDGLDFVAMEPGQVVRLQTFGQGGTHALLAIRCIGFGNRAFVTVTITNLTSLTSVTSPRSARPDLLLCRDEQTCDRLPLLVMTGGLTAPDEERDGLRVRISAVVENADGDIGAGSQEAVLSTEDL